MTKPHSFKASRQGRYRKLLIAPQSLLPLASSIAAAFNALDKKRMQGILSDAEFLSYGLLTLLACRRTDAFQTDKKNRVGGQLHPLTSSNFTLTDFIGLLSAHHLPINGFKKIPDEKISVHTFLNQIRFRGIPDSARMALLAWLNHQYPLTLVFHVPTPVEVFELQKQGGRCISFFKQASEITKFHHGRDAISFIVHDLIHAHEFYSLPKRAQQQIGFYHWLDDIKKNILLKNLLMESSAFLECWEYVLSDMNSYGGHLLKTLHAAFTLHAKPGEGESLWKNVVDTSDLSPHEKMLFYKINSVEWGEADFLYLESILENRFQKAEIRFPFYRVSQ